MRLSFKTRLVVFGLLISLAGGNSVFAAAGGVPGEIVALQATVAALQSQVQSLTGTGNSLLSQLQTAQGQISTLQSQVAAIQANHALALGPYVSVDSTTINGLTGPHVIFTGANVHVRSGSGRTADSCALTGDPCASGTLTGLGNLVVGYDEVPDIIPLLSGDRGGSHNLIIGIQHRYRHVGGFVVGFQNTLSGLLASVSGGSVNTASGFNASVSGGSSNTASGGVSSVSGGNGNRASAAAASVSGGQNREATGVDNWAAGGLSQPN